MQNNKVELPVAGEFVENDMCLLMTKDKMRGVQCEYCPAIIYKHREVGGMLHTLEGLPICPKCRILKKSKHADEIKADKINYESDKKIRDSQAQQQADEDIKDIAYQSQIATNTRISK